MAKGFHDERYRWLISRLVEARKEAGLSQQAVADRIGWHQQHVSRYETGERRLDIVELMDIGRVINLDVLALLNELPSR